MVRNLVHCSFFAALLLAIPQRSTADEFNLVIQPVYSPDVAVDVYKPLLDYLNRATTHQISLVTIQDFHRYWTKMRAENDWHIVFDDPHLTDYRVVKYGYRPIAKVAGDTVFATVAGPNIQRLERRALVGRRIATMPSPSLGFVLLARWYNDPLGQPEFMSGARSWPDAVEIVFAGEADGAMVPLWLAQRYPNLAPIEQTEPRPGAAVSVSPAVSSEAAAEIAEALLTLHEDEGLFDVLVELNIEKFVATDAAEYAGQSEVLKNVRGY